MDDSYSDSEKFQEPKFKKSQIQKKVQKQIQKIKKNLVQ